VILIEKLAEPPTVNVYVPGAEIKPYNVADCPDAEKEIDSDDPVFGVGPDHVHPTRVYVDGTNAFGLPGADTPPNTRHIYAAPKCSPVSLVAPLYAATSTGGSSADAPPAHVSVFEDAAPAA
jgi:hypothetical protein